MTALPRSDRHLEQLYDISKLFAAFEAVDRTVDAALKIVTDKMPLESAILIQAMIGGHTDMVVWPCVDSLATPLASAKAHAAAAYAYLIGATSAGEIDAGEEVRERVGPSWLPALAPDYVRPDDRRRFIVIPLVVGHGIVFGALQLEGAVQLDRSDLEFVNAIANQLAVALDRHRAWTLDVVRRRDALRLKATYETLVDHLDAAFVWRADADTRRLTYVSAQFVSLFGDPERCLNDPAWWIHHVHRDDQPLLWQTFARALVEPGNQRAEHRCITADGEIRWLRTSIQLVCVGNEPPHLQGVSFDITDARLAQDRLRDQLSFTTAMAASLTEGTLAIDREDRITFINPVAADLLGCEPYQVQGSPSAALFRIETAAGQVLESPLNVAIQTGQTRSSGHFMVSTDRQRFAVSYIATPILRDGNVTGAVLAFNDLGDRRHLPPPIAHALEADLPLADLSFSDTR